MLLRAIHAQVASVLVAERAGHYINVLYALQSLRRNHELEPRHEELYARVAAPQQTLGGDYDPQVFAADLDQLLAWGAIERITEAQRLRGYKDNRRVRFRYRIHGDATALLEWLESRLVARLEGRVADGRDRLADVLAALKEMRRLLDAQRKGEGADDDARRASYLLEAVGEAIADIGAELLAFRAEMAGFAQRPYDIAALRDILAWMERYVAVHLVRVEQLRSEIEGRLAELCAPRYRQALAECRAAAAAERAAMPRVLRPTAPLQGSDAMLDAAERFFQPAGRLAELRRHIDESARAVAQKMHRHIRELERRSAHLDDVRAAIRALAMLPADDVRPFARLQNRLLASAHVRADRRPASAGQRVMPPAPRKHALDPAVRAAPRPLAAKQASVAEARALRARRLAELRDWVLGTLLAGRGNARLSQVPPAAADGPRRWLDVARARHLGSGRHLAGLGIRITDAPGEARLGDDRCGLAAPDCTIEKEE